MVFLFYNSLFVSRKFRHTLTWRRNIFSEFSQWYQLVASLPNEWVFLLNKTGTATIITSILIHSSVAILVWIFSLFNLNTGRPLVFKVEEWGFIFSQVLITRQEDLTRTFVEVQLPLTSKEILFRDPRRVLILARWSLLQFECRRKEQSGDDILRLELGVLLLCFTAFSRSLSGRIVLLKIAEEVPSTNGHWLGLLMELAFFLYLIVRSSRLAMNLSPCWRGGKAIVVLQTERAWSILGSLFTSILTTGRCSHHAWKVMSV